MQANYDTMMADMRVCSYFSSEARDAGCDPLEILEMDVQLPLPAEALTNLQPGEHLGDLRPIGYALLKTLPEWVSAVDC